MYGRKVSLSDQHNTSLNEGRAVLRCIAPGAVGWGILYSAVWWCAVKRLIKQMHCTYMAVETEKIIQNAETQKSLEICQN